MATFGFEMVYIIIFIIVVLAWILRARVSKEDKVEGRQEGTSGSAGEEEAHQTYEPTPSMVRPLILALKDRDWEKRSAAAIGLANFGDITAFEPLVRTLFHDENEVVRENAVLSLVRVGGEAAVDPLMRVVGNHLRGAKKATPTVIASAVSLGEIGEPKALRCLKQLCASLDEAGLTKETKEVSNAIKKIELNVKPVDKKCVVCNLPFKKGEKLVRCPSCGNVAHKTHMLEWLHVKSRCPVCQEHISESLLKEVWKN